MKSVYIRSFFALYFFAFGLNAKRYRVSLRFQSECGKMRTGKTPNTDFFHTIPVEDKVNSLLLVNIPVKNWHFDYFIMPKDLILSFFADYAGSKEKLVQAVYNFLYWRRVISKLFGFYSYFNFTYFGSL